MTELNPDEIARHEMYYQLMTQKTPDEFKTNDSVECLQNHTNKKGLIADSIHKSSYLSV